jgi:hypothetical protein
LLKTGFPQGPKTGQISKVIPLRFAKRLASETNSNVASETNSNAASETNSNVASELQQQCGFRDQQQLVSSAASETSS